MYKLAQWCWCPDWSAFPDEEPVIMSIVVTSSILVRVYSLRQPHRVNEQSNMLFGFYLFVKEECSLEGSQVWKEVKVLCHFYSVVSFLSHIHTHSRGAMETYILNLKARYQQAQVDSPQKEVNIHRKDTRLCHMRTWFDLLIEKILKIPEDPRFYPPLGCEISMTI